MKIFRNKWLFIILLILAAIAFTIARISKGMRINQSTHSVSTQQVSKNEVSSMPACVCHSKKPSMVRMHDALTGESCGDCHTQGENLMDPNRPPTSPADMDRRIKTEAVCKRCHLDDGTILGTKTQSQKAKISGALFCPKCRKQVNIKDRTCSDCGGTITKTKSGWQCSTCGPLVDVDKIAAISKKKPSNDICKICHFDDKDLDLKHNRVEAYNKSLASVPGGLNNCLACHKSHNQCGGCHF